MNRLILCVALTLPTLASAELPPEPALPTASPEEGPETDPKEWRLQPPRVYGYLQVHYRHAFETGDDGVVDYYNFRVQRVRLGVEGEVLPWLGYTIEIDPRAPEIAGVLRDAYLDFKLIPGHKIRLGQQKTRFGYENGESSTRLYAVNRAELSDNLSRGLNLRDIGIGVLGHIRLPGRFRLEDEITWVNGAGLNVQADDTFMKNVWGRLGVRYKYKKLGGLVARLGVSGGYGDLIDTGEPDDPEDDFRLVFARLGVDLEIDSRWLLVTAEYVQGWNEDKTRGETDGPSGFYVNVVGKLPYDFGPIVRYDTLGDSFERWTFGAFYGLAKSRFRVMLNYEMRLRKDEVRADDKLYLWAQAKF